MKNFMILGGCECPILRSNLKPYIIRFNIPEALHSASMDSADKLIRDARDGTSKNRRCSTSMEIARCIFRENISLYGFLGKKIAPIFHAWRPPRNSQLPRYVSQMEYIVFCETGFRVLFYFCGDFYFIDRAAVVHDTKE